MDQVSFDSFRLEIAIASLSFASLFIYKSRVMITMITMISYDTDET